MAYAVDGGANQVPVSDGASGITWQQIGNAQVATAAAIAYSKLNLTSSIVNADISGSAAIGISKLASYPADSTKYLRGDGTWVAISSGPGAPATSLPGSPTDGQQAILTDSTSAPTYAWLLQYSTTASKWIFIGGSAAHAEVATAEGTTSTSYTDLATAGPSFTLPRTGSYRVQIGFQGSGTTNGDGLLAAVKLGAAATADADSAGSRIDGASSTRVATGFADYVRSGTASDVWKVQYRLVTGNAGTTFFRRTLTITPVTLS